MWEEIFYFLLLIRDILISLFLYANAKSNLPTKSFHSKTKNKKVLGSVWIIHSYTNTKIKMIKIDNNN